MPLTIEVTDRDFDARTIISALQIPAKLGYIAEITVDEPAHGSVVFHGDVALSRLDTDAQVLFVREWSAGDLTHHGPEHRFNVEDIRRISFY